MKKRQGEDMNHAGSSDSESAPEEESNVSTKRSVRLVDGKRNAEAKR